MRHEIGKLVHQVDAQIVIVDTDMHVHAAHHEPARRALHFPREREILLLLRRHLPGRACKGVRRGGNWRKTVAARQAHDHLAQASKVGARLGNRVAHARAHFQLRAQKLRTDLSVAPLGAFM